MKTIRHLSFLPLSSVWVRFPYLPLIQMNSKEMNRVLEEVWKDLLPMISQDEEPQKKVREKTEFYLGERKVEPVNPVIFENGVFFVERGSSFLVIRPKTMKRYTKKIRGTERTIKIEKGAKDIMIPFIISGENPLEYFKQTYLDGARNNLQGRFVRKVWEYRDEIFGGGIVG